MTKPEKPSWLPPFEASQSVRIKRIFWEQAMAALGSNLDTETSKRIWKEIQSSNDEYSDEPFIVEQHVVKALDKHALIKGRNKMEYTVERDFANNRLVIKFSKAGVDYTISEKDIIPGNFSDPAIRNYIGRLSKPELDNFITSGYCLLRKHKIMLADILERGYKGDVGSVPTPSKPSEEKPQIEEVPMQELSGFLASKPRPYIESVLIMLWKGAVLFNLDTDERTKTKENLAAFIMKEFEQGAVQSVIDIIEGRAHAGQKVLSADPLSPEQKSAAGTASNQLANALESLMQQATGGKSSIDPEQVRAIVKEEIANLPPLKIDLKVNGKPLPIPEGYQRPEFFELLERALHRLNILMVGPAGCGKTHLARQVANALELRFGSISCSAGMSESHLTGWLLPTGENARFEYVRSVFVDIYENGGVFLFDEIDAADANTLLFVNQALANGSFFMPQRFENPEVKRHPDAIIMGAANTHGTGGSMAYAGRERLDEATLDRFRAGLVEIGYDEQLEKTVIEKDVLAWGRKVRAKIQEAKLNRVMSTRFLIDATKLKGSGATIEKIQSIYFCGWKEDEKRKVA